MLMMNVSPSGSVPARVLRLAPTRDWIGMRDGQVVKVSVRGKVRLVAPDLATAGQRRRMQPLTIEGRPTVLVDAPVRQLRRAAERYLGSDLRLAGKRIL